MAFLQLAAAVVLGLVVTWAVHRWIDFVGSLDLAFYVGFPLLCLFGFIYDRRQAKKRRASGDR